jgi:hypothetical protein
MNRALVMMVLACGLMLAGCMTRRLNVTSSPSGAAVTINDVEVGRTPVGVDFTYYGSYDVLVTLDGYEPLRTRAKANAPVYEYPPLDLVASVLPLNGGKGIHTDVRWHFDLQPLPERALPKEQFEQELLDRARAMRETLTP